MNSQVFRLQEANSVSSVAPIDFVEEVSTLIRRDGDDWFSMAALWEATQRDFLEAAHRLSEKVQSYQDSRRNNETWFMSNICWHVAKPPEFEMSNTEEHPEAAAFWAIIRKRKA